MVQLDNVCVTHSNELGDQTKRGCKYCSTIFNHNSNRRFRKHLRNTHGIKKLLDKSTHVKVVMPQALVIDDPIVPNALTTTSALNNAPPTTSAPNNASATTSAPSNAPATTSAPNNALPTTSALNKVFAKDQGPSNDEDSTIDKKSANDANVIDTPSTKIDAESKSSTSTDTSPSNLEIKNWTPEQLIENFRMMFPPHEDNKTLFDYIRSQRFTGKIFFEERFLGLGIYDVKSELARLSKIHNLKRWEATIIHKLITQKVAKSSQNISLSELLPKDTINWSDALQYQLCKLYEQKDVVDIFWGRCFTSNNLLPWGIYVIMRGGYYPPSRRITLDGQNIWFKSEASFNYSIHPFGFESKLQIFIPPELRDAFDKALDHELTMETRKKHYNLIAISTGYKITGGKMTDIPAIILHVKQKGIEHRGCPGLFPTMIRGFATDVQEAVTATPCVSSGLNLCRNHQSSIKLGCSIGSGINNYTISNVDNWQEYNPYTTCGTLGAFAHDALNNDHGILSCQHVLQYAETNPNGDLSIHQPADEDFLTSHVKHLQDLKQGSGQASILVETARTSYKNYIDRMLTYNIDTTLARYVRGVRRNVTVNCREFGVDAAFAKLDDCGGRTMARNKFSVNEEHFRSIGFSNTLLTSVYDYNSLQLFDRNEAVFKVGRTTGITCGNWELDTSIAMTLASDSVEDLSIADQVRHLLGLEQNSLDEKTMFFRYLKSPVEDIPDRRQACFPHIWFDRQMAVKFKPGDVKKGDSGASLVDKNGKALGMLHTIWGTNYHDYAIVSPYFAVCQALNVIIET